MPVALFYSIYTFFLSNFHRNWREEFQSFSGIHVRHRCMHLSDLYLASVSTTGMTATQTMLGRVAQSDFIRQLPIGSPLGGR